LSGTADDKIKYFKKFGNKHLPPHICNAMKQIFKNNSWWWHTNLDRGL